MHDFVVGEEARGGCYFNSARKQNDAGLSRMTQTSVLECTRYHCEFGPEGKQPASTEPLQESGARSRAPSKKVGGTCKRLKIVWSHTVYM